MSEPGALFLCVAPGIGKVGHVMYMSVMRFNLPVNNFSVKSGLSQRFPVINTELLVVKLPCSRTQHGAARGGRTQDLDSESDALSLRP